MRFIDGTLGYLLVNLLALWASMWQDRTTLPTVGSRPILVIKFFGIGSIQYSSPLLRGLRQRYPLAQICFMTFQANTSFVQLMPDVDLVLGVRNSSFIYLVIDTFRALLFLRRRHVRMVIDLEFFSKFSTAISYLSGAPCRVGYQLAAFWRRSLLTHCVPFRSSLHIVDCILEVASVLDLTVQRALVPLSITLEDLNFTRSLIKSHFSESSINTKNTKNSKNSDNTINSNNINNIHNSSVGNGVGGSVNSAVNSRAFRAVKNKSRLPLIAVNVNAGETSLLRRWPRERFVRLIESLQGQANFVLTGSTAERPYVESVIRALTPASRDYCFNVAGQLTAAQLVALFRLVSLLITNDTGPLHIAAGVACPTVAIFGPESPARYGPINPNCRCVYLRLPCSPCISFDNGKVTKCKLTARCINEVSVEQVLEQVLSLEASSQSGLA